MAYCRKRYSAAATIVGDHFGDHWRFQAKSYPQAIDFTGLRGGRVVEGTSLENWQRRKAFVVRSPPPGSAGSEKITPSIT